MEQLDYNLLFRWFVGLSLDAAVWDVTVFTKGSTGNYRIDFDRARYGFTTYFPYHILWW